MYIAFSLACSLALSLSLALSIFRPPPPLLSHSLSPRKSEGVRETQIQYLSLYI